MSTEGKSNVQLLKEFFEGDRPLTMAELKALSKEERQELADMIRALGE